MVWLWGEGIVFRQICSDGLGVTNRLSVGAVWNSITDIGELDGQLVRKEAVRIRACLEIVCNGPLSLRERARVRAV